VFVGVLAGIDWLGTVFLFNQGLTIFSRFSVNVSNSFFSSALTVSSFHLKFFTFPVSSNSIIEVSLFAEFWSILSSSLDNAPNVAPWALASISCCSVCHLTRNSIADLVSSFLPVIASHGEVWKNPDRFSIASGSLTSHLTVSSNVSICLTCGES